MPALQQPEMYTAGAAQLFDASGKLPNDARAISCASSRTPSRAGLKGRRSHAPHRRRPGLPLKVLQAADVMTGWVATVSPDATVQEAAQMMIERRVSGLPVVNRNERVVGIVSEGDLMRRTEIGTAARRTSWLQRLLDSGARDHPKTKGGKVRDVMSKPVITIRLATPLHEVAELLDEKRIKRVPVVDRGRLAGIVSRVDLVRRLALAPTRPTARTARERKLRQQALEAARSTGARGLNLNVIVERGVVHLWGEVRSRAEQKAVLKAVRAVDGARKIRDHTSVIPLRVAAELDLL